MRPLKDHDSPASPIEADAADLLRAAVKYDPAPGQKQRVRARILAHGVAGHRGLRFRPSVVAGVVLFGAVASAAAGRHWIARMTELPGGTSDPRKPEDLPARQVLPGQRAAGLIATASASASAPANETAGRGTTPRPERASPAERRAIARRAPAKADDSTLVFDAVRALRQDRAPMHALALLQEYSQLHPRGPLAEEVLALSIEAATMCGDPRAQALIDQYLSRYPTGHFRAAVETSRARLPR